MYARGLATWLSGVAPRRARGAVTVALLGDRHIRKLNRRYRGVDTTTDVLSFPAAEHPRGRRSSSRRRRNKGPASIAGPPARMLGDVVIATGVARRQAREAGHSYQTELRVLALHGLLHLLGFDHERDRGRMARLEARLRRQGRLREGLIERTSRKP